MTHLAQKLLIGALVLICSNSIGQVLDHKYDWYKGIIITNAGDTIYGRVNYDQFRKVVVLRDSTSYKTFSARNVEYFRMLDTEFGLVRTFSSISYLTKSGYQTKEFFELVLTGKITIVREGIRDKFNNIKFVYFSLVDSQLSSMRDFHKRLLPQLETEFPELTAQIKEKELNPKRKFDKLMIVDLYNSLADPAYEPKIGDNYATQQFLQDL